MYRFPPQKIMVPTDLSGVSLSAVHLARRLAGTLDADLEALFVEEPVPLREWNLVNSPLDPARKEKIRRRLRRAAGAQARQLIKVGDPVETIKRLSRLHGTDMIVMGTHSRSTMERVLLGSVTQSVVRSADVPVLTVRREVKPIRTILAPVNFTDYSDFGFLAAVQAANAFKAKLTLLHVTQDPARGVKQAAEMRRMIKLLPKGLVDAVDVRVIVRSGNVVETILRTARSHDLVVLVAHRKNILEDIVLGTTVERVLRHSESPVLSFPPPPTEFDLLQELFNVKEIVAI